MAQLALTNNQQQIMTTIRENDWITIHGISEKTGISRGQVRNILKTNNFKDIRRGKKLEKRDNRMKYIAVFQYPHKDKSHTEKALALATTHQGIFGQLFWANDLYENIERVA